MIHADLLGERARLTPVKTALVDVASGGRFTYAELDARATAVAKALRHGFGLAAGDRLGLLAGNSVEFLDLFFAALKSGVVLVPLSTRLTPRELAPIVHDSGMRALVYDGATLEAVRGLRPLVALERWVTIDERAAPADETLAARVKAALRDTRKVDAQGVGIKVADGVVTLHGTVPGAEESRDIAAFVARVDGVRSVVNNLVVIRGS